MDKFLSKHIPKRLALLLESLDFPFSESFLSFLGLGSFAVAFD